MQRINQRRKTDGAQMHFLNVGGGIDDFWPPNKSWKQTDSPASLTNFVIRSGGADVSRTYTKDGPIANVFVPDELEQIIHECGGGGDESAGLLMQRHITADNVVRNGSSESTSKDTTNASS